MQQALLQAEKAPQTAKFPLAQCLIGPNGLLAAAGNSPISRHDPTAHAEIIAIRNAAEHLHNYRLPGTTLYVTLEPCIMCMGALIQARIERLVYGAADPKTGAASSVYTIGSDGFLNHKIAIRRRGFGRAVQRPAERIFSSQTKGKKRFLRLKECTFLKNAYFLIAKRSTTVYIVPHIFQSILRRRGDRVA